MLFFITFILLYISTWNENNNNDDNNNNKASEPLNTTKQIHSTKPKLRFSSGSNPASGVLEICDGENLW